MVRNNHSDSSETPETENPGENKLQGAGKKNSKDFFEPAFRAEISCSREVPPIAGRVAERDREHPSVSSGKCGWACDVGLRGGGGRRLGEARTAPLPNSFGFSSPNR